MLDTFQIMISIFDHPTSLKNIEHNLKIYTNKIYKRAVTHIIYSF